LTKWYDDCPDMDHLLMVDNDMSFNCRLIMDMIALKKPVVGTIYHRRQCSERIWDLVVGVPLPGEPRPIVNGFQEWKYVGAGVLLIKRRVVTEMLQRMPELSDVYDPGAIGAIGISRIIKAFDEMKDKQGRPLSEDLSFCERWRQCDGEIWANVERPVAH